MIKKVLTIAGSDSSGGAGIQADIKTITVNKMYAMSVITALTAQNTTGVTSIMEATPEFVADQLDAVFTDIFPDAVKIGMVSSGEIINVIVDKLKEYKAVNIVVDPVMVSTSGCKLIGDDAIGVLTEKLIPIADIITPNIPEAEILSGMSIHNEQDMIKAAEITAKKYNGKIGWFSSERINNPNTHGTGCTLSSAIACGLADGKTIEESIKSAKEYLTGALRAMLDLGKGSGPLEHNYCIIS